MLRPLTTLVVVALFGAGASAILTWRLGAGEIGAGGLAASLVAAVAVLASAVIQLVRPRPGTPSVLAANANLLSAAALITGGGLLAGDDRGPREVWFMLLGAAVAVAGWCAIAYIGQGRPTPGEPPTVEAGEVPETVNGDTVEVLLGAMRDLLAAEDLRAQSLNARATGLGGFAALLVALLLPAARDLGDGRGPEPLTASIILVAVAGALLVSGVLAVLIGVVVTRQVSTVSISEVQLWESTAFVEKSPTWVRGRLLVTLRKSLVTERRANNRKAGWLSGAVVVIAAGVLCAALGSLTLLL